MFPAGCPPVTVVSQNVYYEPHFHIAIGRALRPLRKEGYLLIGSGGGVHNLYRADYTSNWLYRDAFAQRYPPDATHLEFRQALEDVLCKNGAGPELKSAVVRLMKHPNYRDAHGTDDHYMPTCFIAGVVGEEEDRGEEATLACEMWELVSDLLSPWSCVSNVLIGLLTNLGAEKPGRDTVYNRNVAIEVDLSLI